MSLVARYLEANDIPTVVLGSALDIVTHCRVARYLFTDFPLGNPCGAPGDAPMQARIVRSAVELFETAEEAETLQISAERWPQGYGWRARYSEVRPEDRDRLRAEGDARRAKQARSKDR